MAKINYATVPNQKICVVHRETIGKNFISISKDNYTKAYRDMSGSSSALGLYVWLVGNQDKYRFALSPQAIENQLGMARSSYHGAINKLKDLGYIVEKEDSNIYDFYEVTPGKTDRKLVESDAIIFDQETTKAYDQTTSQNNRAEFTF